MKSLGDVDRSAGDAQSTSDAVNPSKNTLNNELMFSGSTCADDIDGELANYLAWRIWG